MGFKILNFNIFWGFQRNEYFWGYEDFVDIFWGVITNWTKLRGHFYVLYGLFKVNVQKGGIFGVAKISNIFLGCLNEIPDIFLGVNGRCWARAYVYRKNESTHPPPPPPDNLRTHRITLSHSLAVS